jgi:hypothetical protein
LGQGPHPTRREGPRRADRSGLLTAFHRPSHRAGHQEQMREGRSSFVRNPSFGGVTGDAPMLPDARYVALDPSADCTLRNWRGVWRSLRAVLATR